MELGLVGARKPCRNRPEEKKRKRELQDEEQHEDERHRRQYSPHSNLEHLHCPIPNKTRLISRIRNENPPPFALGFAEFLIPYQFPARLCNAIFHKYGQKS